MVCRRSSPRLKKGKSSTHTAIYAYTSLEKLFFSVATRTAWWRKISNFSAHNFVKRKLNQGWTGGVRIWVAVNGEGSNSDEAPKVAMWHMWLISESLDPSSRFSNHTFKVFILTTPVYQIFKLLYRYCSLLSYHETCITQRSQGIDFI